MRARPLQNDELIHFESILLDTWNEPFWRSWDDVVVHHQYLGSLSVRERTLLMEAQMAIQCLLSVAGQTAEARASCETTDFLTAMYSSGWEVLWHGLGRTLILLIRKDCHALAPKLRPP